ncbi:pyridoxamine 5'-phosphate oxidase family protein [Microbacterium sp. H1-D42]|uniref:pyridoxine/pyridoxamine 5'-phosphate oxidase n=1 Tax=Microbacterium sp. H1-D42 TaxID=2925844 RepID=UPI001F52BEC2|nr:pyridoxamine 5'-phosphate oxidase family protein [Microbacterium sp. H1-D42]UNK72020.1 pyridoxamine 5'-phosphate oxidase family protein [Microbacterium sp. H1-D42]
MTDGAWLRSLPSLAGVAPAFDPVGLPADPVALFDAWLADAVALGVPEPHAMTLATVDADGVPDARTLILKGVSERGWAFAGHRTSAKGRQLAANPAAALSFWWQPIVRAVRVRGRVEPASDAESAADLAARSAAARSGIEPGEWMLWRVVPERVEFWQGRPDRDHVRVVYRRDVDGWNHDVLRAESAAEEEARR